MRTALARSALVAALLSLAGCASPFGPPGPMPPPEPAVVGDTGAGPDTGAAGGSPQNAAPGAPEPNRASVALLASSRESSASGDYATAAITLERAVAIDPNNALLWIELAETRWRQGDRSQADSLARKALTLAGSDRSITERARRLMSR